MVTRIKPPRSKQRRRKTARGTKHYGKNNDKKKNYKKQQRRRRSLTMLLLCGVVLYGVASWMDWLPMSDSGLNSGRTVQVYNTETGKLMAMDLEQYLVGVVAAEMPASFDEEALKAQAVAARTFTVSRMLHPNPNVTALNPLAQLSTSPETCQAWIDKEEQKARWGKQYRTYHQKIAQAVADTAGEVLRYDGMLIEPLYHASCGGGKTEDAKNVWGNAKPYLVSVDCQHPPDPHSKTKISMTLEDMAGKLELSDAIPAMASGDYMQVLSSTDADRVTEIRVGNQIFTGAEFREALQLKSSLFSWNVEGDTITFITNGYGHGVGLCQYGANYYAGKGDGYQQILSRYYPGTQLSKE